MGKKRSQKAEKSRHTFAYYRKLGTPYYFLLPVVLFIVVFMIWPIINVFIMAFQEYDVIHANTRHFIGFQNFIQIFTQDDIFYKTIGNTLFYVVVSVIIEALLGFWLAYLLTREFKGRGVIRALTLVPWAVAGIMVGIIWGLMFGQTYGVINDLLRKLGLIQSNISWLGSSGTAMFAVCVANIWRAIPFFAISFMSALSSIPADIYEAAKIDGSNSVQTMFRVTIPMIKDTIVLTTLLRAIWTFNAVDLIISLTDGGPNRGTTTLTLYIMNTFTNNFNYGYASALSVIATLLMMVFALLYIRLTRTGKEGVY